MLDSISGAARAAGHAEAAAGGTAHALVAAARQQGVVNPELLARELAPVVAQDPKRAAELLAEIRPQLAPADQQLLARELAEQVDAQAAGLARQKQDLALDLTQIGLSIAGIFDPTPISDGLDGLISLFRGDFLGAGISVVSMVPYIGDAAKLGKLGRFAETVAKAVDLAKLDPAFARTVRPALEKIGEAIAHVPLEHLPRPAREALEAMKTKIDELASAARAGSSVSTKVGRNDVKWTLDADGRTVQAEATLRETFSGAARSAAEQRAQREVAAAGGRTDDAGGHIIGHRFVTDQGTVNLIPQNKQFNNSAYKKLENEWADHIAAGREVQVNVRLSGGSAERPDRIDVFYKVRDPSTGEVLLSRRTAFDNEAGQTFDRIPRRDIR